MPQARFGGEWLHPSLPEMAAAYLLHLVRHHPFVDGNKRAGLMCALAFLGLNDVEVVAKPEELLSVVLGVAEGRADKAQVAVFLKANTG
jgi:death on curing protein